MTVVTEPFIDFRVERDQYRHWTVSYDGPVATVTMAVDSDGGLRSDDYQLKTNSYDLGVDIELHDIVQRLRFEHPEVKAVVMTGGLEKIFCAGANIQMLSTSSHAHKVNFCKFTNETRNSIEDATKHSGQAWVAAVNGTAAGGGYELALACDEILLIDDRASAVSLPEVPLLAVLPGTGGLTRVVDKRNVRRDRADIFATRTEGVRGRQAVEWGLVDAIAPASEFTNLIAERTAERVAASDRPDAASGIELTRLERMIDGDDVSWGPVGAVAVAIDRGTRSATITVTGPTGPQPSTAAELRSAGSAAWVLGAARELDDAILHLRFNEPEIGTWLLKTDGTSGNGDGVAAVLAAEAVLRPEAVLGPDGWLAREVRLLWARVLKRLDLSARSIFALIEPGSCFAGVLAELALAADRSYMLDGTWEDSDLPSPTLQLTDANRDWFPMSNGLSRLESRFWGHPDDLEGALALTGETLDGPRAEEVGLVTAAMDDIDWDDEIRVMIEERASFSPDALTGMEANHRFVGPETTETKIFARLTAWQNWIFQRPNAVGPEGALQRFGTGARPAYDRRRV
jgi:benzoyl-CoA-dihydrodiol lyase